MTQFNNTQKFPDGNNWLDIENFIQCTEVVPTAKPKNISGQIVIVSGGGSTRAYLYDISALAWKYVTLT